MGKSLADRKKQFLEDCCGGGPTMSMGDAGYTSAAPAEGPVAGYDPMLGKKKRKSAIDMGKKLRKEGYVKLTDRKHDKMNDAALRHDMKRRRKNNPGVSDEDLIGSSDFSYEGDHITKHVADSRDNPTEYAKDKKSQETSNRARGYRRRK